MEKCVILFDGHCGLCSYWVHQLCKWDRNDRFRFASLHSTTAVNLLTESKIDTTKHDSILVFRTNQQPVVEAGAVFAIIDTLGGWWKSLLVLNLLPDAFLNWAYRWVAKNRHRWFTQRKDCAIPDKNNAFKFL